MKRKPIVMLDFSGVYFTKATGEAVKKLSRKFRLPEKKIVHALLNRTYSRKYYEGKISRKTFWKLVLQRLNLQQKEAREMEHIWHSSVRLQKGMKQLVRKLKKKYKVVSLAGQPRERIRFLEKKYKISREFDGQHYSFRYGAEKYGARLFKLAAAKMHVRPEDCIVVDDQKRFLDNVKKTGAKTILFKDAKHLERELSKLGVDL